MNSPNKMYLHSGFSMECLSRICAIGQALPPGKVHQPVGYSTLTLSFSISPRQMGRRFVKTFSYMCTLALTQSIPGLEKSYSSLFLLVFTLSAALLAKKAVSGCLRLRKLQKKKLSYDKKTSSKGNL